MINLLPPGDKTEIKKEYLARFAAVLAFALFFSLIIAIVFLLPSLFLVNSQAQNYGRQVSLSKQRLALSEAAGAISAVQELNAKLKIFDGRRNDSAGVTEVIGKIIGGAPRGIKLNAFSYGARTAKKGHERSVSVRGAASSRKKLLQFMDGLKNDPAFEDVKSPPSNLLKERNIDFSILITLKKNEE